MYVAEIGGKEKIEAPAVQEEKNKAKEYKTRVVSYNKDSKQILPVVHKSIFRYYDIDQKEDKADTLQSYIINLEEQRVKSAKQKVKIEMLKEKTKQFVTYSLIALLVIIIVVLLWFLFKK